SVLNSGKLSCDWSMPSRSWRAEISGTGGTILFAQGRRVPGRPFSGGVGRGRESSTRFSRASRKEVGKDRRERSQGQRAWRRRVDLPSVGLREQLLFQTGTRSTASQTVPSRSRGDALVFGREKEWQSGARSYRETGKRPGRSLRAPKPRVA